MLGNLFSQMAARQFNWQVSWLKDILSTNVKTSEFCLLDPFGSLYFWGGLTCHGVVVANSFPWWGFWPLGNQTSQAHVWTLRWAKADVSTPDLWHHWPSQEWPWKEREWRHNMWPKVVPPEATVFWTWNSAPQSSKLSSAASITSFFIMAASRCNVSFTTMAPSCKVQQGTNWSLNGSSKAKGYRKLTLIWCIRVSP